MEHKAHPNEGNSILQDMKLSHSSDDFQASGGNISNSKTASEESDTINVPKLNSNKSQDNSRHSNNSLEQILPSSMQSDIITKSPVRANSTNTNSIESKYQGVLESFLSAQSQQPKEPVKTSKSSTGTVPMQETVLKSGKYKEWLECEKKNEQGRTQIIFYCKWCRNTKQDIDLGKGINLADLQGGLQTRMFKEHKESTQHNKAKEVYLKKSYRQDPNMTMILDQPQDKYSITLSNTIAMLIDLLKQNLTLDSCLDVLKSAASRGVDLSVNDLTYTAMKELIKTLSDCRKEYIVQEINSSPYFSLILCPWPPSSISGTKSFEIVCYYIKQGVPKHAYFDTIVLKEAEYCGLLGYKRLVNFLKKSGIEYQQKLVGLFTNGDCFFNSKNTGISDLLKKEVSDIIAIHPLSYRYFTVSLQNYEITKAFPIVEHIFQLCLDTFHYFNTSQKSVKELFENRPEIEELLADTSGTRNPGTKWSSLLSGILRIVAHYEKVQKELKEAKDFQSKGLEIHLRNTQYLAWMHFLADLGPFATGIGSVFREKTLSLRGKVKTVLGYKKKITETFLAAETGLSIKEGFWRGFVEGINKEQLVYKDAKLSEQLEVEKYEKDFRRFIEIFLDDVDRRYGNVYELESIGTFDILYLKEKAKDASTWQVTAEKIKESGHKFLKVLEREEFLERLGQELPHLLKYLKENCRNDTKATTLNELFSFCQEKFPVSIDLISRFCVLPFGLGEVEKALRSFGRVQGRIKGSMSDDLVRAILSINLFPDEGDEGRLMLVKSVEEWRKKIFVA